MNLSISMDQMQSQTKCDRQLEADKFNPTTCTARRKRPKASITSQMNCRPIALILSLISQCYILCQLASTISGSGSQLFVKSPAQQFLQQASSPVPNYSSQMMSFLQTREPQQQQQTYQNQQQQQYQSSRRSQLTFAPNNNDNSQQHQQQQQLEARGALSRNLYSRGARNASSSSTNSALGSWHFPRISPEQAAEVLITGAQVINRIAQAETPLNYCRTPDNQEGECSDIRKCIWLVLDKARLKQSVCLRNLIIPAVCCPLSNANNTVANMIQSTLEPVLFRPKAPKQKKPLIGTPHMQPFTTIVNKTILGSAPPSPASMIIRNPHLANALNASVQPTTASPATTASSTTSTTMSTTTSSTSTTVENSNKPPQPPVESSSGHASLFQDDFDTSSSSSHHSSHHHHSNSDYNRTVSQKYPWANETCGESGRTRTGRIVGGSDSKLGQWPWMTAMYLNKRSSFSPGAGEFWCGGALINRRFILTAAHCLSDQSGKRYRTDQVTIKLGGVDLVRHQAPPDILRNSEEVESRSLTSFFSSDSSSSSPSNRAPFKHRGSSQQRGTSTGRPAHGTRYTLSNNSTQSRNDSDDEEEFSWTAFITKVLGLGGPSSSSSSSGSSSSSASSSSASQSTSDSHHANNKALNSQQDKKQQLAAHAKKTYFKEYKVANIKQHPKFQRHGFYNDIGLIELKSDVDYDDLISPVCLPTEHDLKRDLSGYVATVLGWGTISYGGSGSKLLQQVAMPIWQNKDCDEKYLQHIGKTFLCAGFLQGGKDACQGDSGGPLMVSDNSGRWTLHGVVSFGKTCAQAHYPGVYTRVTEYLDWIRDNTDLDGYSSLSSSSSSSNGRNPKSPQNTNNLHLYSQQTSS